VWTIRLGGRDRRVARDALRAILAAELGVPAGSVEVETTAEGKPYLPGDPVHFNLSHSSGLALVAICREAPVGIDLEHARELRAPDRLARRICSQREYEWLRSMGGAPSATEALLRLWVRKEAAVKGTGDGLSRDLDEVDVLDDTLVGGWRCVDLPSPAPGYLAALAIRSREPSISLRKWRSDQAVRR
jgi:4'-phosphopantetheinyl transferase